MPRPVSHARLTAEAHAFPFATEAAFGIGLHALSREAAGVLDGGSTKRLADALEEFHRPRAAGMTLELLRQLRDAAWFPEERARPHVVPLAELLTVLAGRYLEWGGTRVRLHSDGAPAERAIAWRWLSFCLPADLLVAALAARDGFEPPDDAVQLVTPRLAELLRDPCAETHLHVGAGVPFGLVWAARMRALATEPQLKFKPGWGRAPFDRAFHGTVLSAAIARLVLAAFLRHREDRGYSGAFTAFVKEVYLPQIGDRVPWGLGAHEAGRVILGALTTLTRGRPTEGVALARRLYQALISGRDSKKSKSCEDIARRDPLAVWLPPGPGRALPETRFASRAIGYLLTHDDPGFARLFWQVQRVRNLTHRFLAEEPGTAGLDWFTRHYARISPMRSELKKLTYTSAFEVQSRDLNLGSLEARTSPEADWVEVRDEVRALAKQASRYEPRPARGRPEVGLVLHFIKEWERSVGGKRTRLHADPRQTAFGCRYGAWFHERRRQAFAVATALRRNPELLLLLRGVDVANVELAEPTWVVLPLFGIVRDAARDASALLARRRPEWEVPPLRATLHAGEDFRRLVEGLRRIHEPIEFGALGVGDRIGHGVALGEDAAQWAASAKSVVQPKEERLDDLLWELDRYRRGDLPVEARRLELVRAQVLELGSEIYRKRVTAEELLEARHLRHNLRALERMGYPFLRVREVTGAADLFYRHLSDRAVFERGQAPIKVDATEHETAMLQCAQRWLRREIGRREITIECNPSSNLVIADYLALEDHAAFRMQPLPHMSEPDGGAVLVSVNTDNPITFATSLADEFAHLYFALLGRGVSIEHALAWLGRSRDNGYRSRFTLRASTSRKALREVAALHQRADRRRGGRSEISS
ncbi:MAG: hypothetical protein U0271_02090 [Polyangiaceae bacterium]